VQDLLERLSPEGRWLRFLGTGPSAAEVADLLAADGVGIVALAGDPSRAVAHACFLVDGEGAAEIAFEVEDAWQGRGIATVLLAHLAQLAAARGMTGFTAFVHPSNRQMLQVFRDSGFPLEVHSEPGLLRVEFPVELSPAARARFEERDDLAAVAAVRHVLEPTSVAVIGASRRRRSIGGAVVRNLVAGGFEGALYPVHPSAPTVARRRAYPSVLDVPGPVELAVVAVPAPAVPGVARACATKGVRALVVLSAGFGESGAEGRALQDELLDVCRSAGMRLVGPNCLGVLNTLDAVRLKRDVRPWSAAHRTNRLRLAERRLRDRGAGTRRAPGPGPVDLRVDWRQGRPLGQRLPALRGARSGQGARAPLPRVARESASLRARSRAA
jgi:GNAT superfamily N-acetyltransferase/predicted CoA-binding protein